MTYNDIWHRLAAVYDDNEAKAVARLLLDEMFGLSLADIVCGAVEQLPASSLALLEAALCRLDTGEPIQYVTGRASFCLRSFHVAPGVLIPRPETEQLCNEVSAAVRPLPHPAVLDIGTGSGCIAVTLALDIPHAEVSAWDISDTALRIAADNARRLSANVHFMIQDALCPPRHRDKWDAIVSNPPYICQKESRDMEDNVLSHEPHLALFVPDSNPLLFYRSIAHYAHAALKPRGMLFFEINPLYAHDTEEMLINTGFDETRTVKDIFGKERYTICRKK